MGRGILVNVGEVWKLLFGTEKPSRRLEWDIEYRKQEFVRACENRNAEGGCYKAGLIEEAFGHIEAANHLMQKACDLRLEEACLWIKQHLQNP
jgi:hypothetical protein